MVDRLQCVVHVLWLVKKNRSFSKGYAIWFLFRPQNREYYLLYLVSSMSAISLCFSPGRLFSEFLLSFLHYHLKITNWCLLLWILPPSLRTQKLLCQDTFKSMPKRSSVLIFVKVLAEMTLQKRKFCCCIL